MGCILKALSQACMADAILATASSVPEQRLQSDRQTGHFQPMAIFSANGSHLNFVHHLQANHWHVALTKGTLRRLEMRRQVLHVLTHEHLLHANTASSVSVCQHPSVHTRNYKLAERAWHTPHSRSHCLAVESLRGGAHPSLRSRTLPSSYPAIPLPSIA
jgi:hypothetical protein